jgi:cytochrome c peroxidase
LSEQELRGLAVFNDPAKGNCARCHQSERGSSGAFPAFTDFGYVALGVPRNRALAVNADPNYYDLGLCGPLREEYRNRAEYCGLFRTPSLRNVTLRKTFFHNGVFHDLRQVLRFYVERDIHPEKWYPNGGAFDDLPTQFRENINREPPFDRHPGDAPALSESEITDVIAFLGTLTDGWSGK